MGRVDSSGAESRAQRLFETIKEAASSGISNARDLLLESAMSRTPSVDQEYNILMVGEGGTSPIPRTAEGSADDDPNGAQRRRLIKSENTYLQYVVPSPQNQELLLESDTPTLRLGNLALLETNTTWGYQNWKKSTGPFPVITKGPYFRNFEYGSSSLIVPVFSGTQKYRLRPDYDSYPASMLKAVRPHNIFGIEILRPLFINAMEEAFSKVGPRSGGSY